MRNSISAVSGQDLLRLNDELDIDASSGEDKILYLYPLLGEGAEVCLCEKVPLYVLIVGILHHSLPVIQLST